ncbi:hypothetical protein GOODEAATRI_033768, partial [Goodea atripinnis]
MNITDWAVLAAEPVKLTDRCTVLPVRQTTESGRGQRLPFLLSPRIHIDPGGIT